MKRILLTGAGGGVAKMIRPMLRETYRLTLSDVVPVACDADETFVAADLADLASVERAVAGVDGIIHLGGQSVETVFETILHANIVGAHNIFEAARRAGVKRVVFASSNHATGFYPRSETTPVDVTVRPDTRYGLSKAFGEATGALYAYKYGAEVLSVRIGHIIPEPIDVRDLSIWLSPRDFVQLVRIGLEHPGIRHEIVYGMSDNRRAWWDNAAATRLGYQPQDRSEDYAAAIVAKNVGVTGDPVRDLNQGGNFCTAEEMVAPR